MRFSDYTFRGNTQSLCPKCLSLVPAKIITRGKRVYFKKRCKQCGDREDFVCSDVDYYDRLEYAVPSKIPEIHGVQPDKGCPYDCGLCTEHEQHTCIALVELTSGCNLSCPMCFASSGPGQRHLSLEQCKASIDRIVATEGGAEVVQLSGGEPTIHPNFEEIFEYAVSKPIDYVTINTNGIRLAKDDKLIELLAKYPERIEVYLQFDGLDDEVNVALRGEPLLDQKIRAVEKLGEAGVHITLAVTMQGGVNDDQYGKIFDFAMQRKWITGLSFQPATYSGRHELPETLEQRVTFPDVIKGLAAGSSGQLVESDFIPLPCAHPNCHSISLSYRKEDRIFPLVRFVDPKKNLDLLANGISFTRDKSRAVVQQLFNRYACCGDGECSPSEGKQNLQPLQGLQTEFGVNDFDTSKVTPEAIEFLTRSMADEIGAEDLFRITITSFLDAYNFRFAAVDEVLYTSRFAKWACDSVLCIQRFISRWSCGVAGVGGSDCWCIGMKARP